MSKHNHLFLAAVLIFAVSGCSPIAVSDEQKQQILSVDPGFGKVLELKAGLDGRLAQARSDFLAEKNIYEARVDMLRREFQAKREQFYVSSREIKSQLNPHRQMISAQIAMLSEELKDKMKARRAIQGMLKQAKAIIEGKFNRELSEKDKLQWQERFESLSAESKDIAQEIAILKERLNILKLKQRSLIQ